MLANGVTSLRQVDVQWAGLCRVCHEIQHELGVNIVVAKILLLLLKCRGTSGNFG